MAETFNAGNLTLDRIFQIWSWLQNPESQDPPANLKEQEVIAVFCRNMMLLQNFKRLLQSGSDLESFLNQRKSGQGWKR